MTTTTDLLAAFKAAETNVQAAQDALFRAQKALTAANEVSDLLYGLLEAARLSGA